jgi:hypothetical protein
MELEPVYVRAKIVMLSDKQGGRRTPLAAGTYWPNHNFWPERQGSPEFCMGSVSVPDEVETANGGFETEVRFMVWPRLRPELRVGRKWQIHEATRVVGHGEILDMLG